MCDTLVSITDDGVVVAKNSDRDPNEAQSLEWVPARDHGPDDVVQCTWIRVPQVAHTHAVLLSRPWWMFGAEMGANSHGVVIGNEAVFTKELARRRQDGEDEPGLLGMDLLRLALERATTAAEAVEVIVTLLERHGQAGPCSWERPSFSYDNSFIVADPDGAIVLETAGRSHATEEVRAGGRSISNGLTIPAFAAAHADPVRSRVAACAVRRARTQRAAAAAGRHGRNPIADLMAALRDHGPDGLPRYSPLNGALDAPCAHAGGLATATQTTASWVADLRDRSAPLHWATGTAAPCTSVFKPVRVEEPAELGPVAGQRFDPSTRWWRHEVLHRATMCDPQALLPRFTHDRDVLEAGWLDDPPATEDAFRAADELERRWAADVVGAAQPERRNRLLRRYWAGQDRDAALPTGPGIGSDRYRPALDAVLGAAGAAPTRTTATAAETGSATGTSARREDHG
jgi:secernin